VNLRTYLTIGQIIDLTKSAIGRDERKKATRKDGNQVFWKHMQMG